MPDRYSEAEIEAMRGTRPHPLAHVIDPRIVQFNEERRRWLATLDAIKAQRDRAVEALRFYAERGTYQQSHGPGCGVDGDGDEHHDSSCGEPDIMRDCGEQARTALARVGKGGA